MSEKSKNNLKLMIACTTANAVIALLVRFLIYDIGLTKEFLAKVFIIYI